MWSGRQTLASIDSAISRLHGEESTLDRATQQAMAELERLRQERGKALRELARLKLDELAAGRLTTNLDAAERRALSLLEGRKTRLARAAEARDGALEAVTAAEERQAEAAGEVEEALAALDALRARTEAALTGDAAINAARDRVREAEDVAAEAARKAEQNAEELAAKKKPYDEDPLFQYLWRRGFGTAAYAGSGLTRFLDRAVARFIGFLDVRANYHMLTEIPLRLAEHAQGRQAALQEAQAALAALEAQALARGGASALEARLAAARRALAKADAVLDERRKALAEADAQREQMLSGAGDPGYVEAVATMAANDSRDSIETLFAEARRTPTEADEALVRQLARLEDQIEEAEEELEDRRKDARKLAERRAEVERTRDRFRRSGYDHPNATFGNERVIAEVLGGILSGALKGSILWDTLRGGYGNRPTSSRPDFGGGFPFPMPGGWGGGGSSGGGWRDPGSAGPWAPDPAPPAGGPWGGGDSGGGSGGGDKFETGGRF